MEAMAQGRRSTPYKPVPQSRLVGVARSDQNRKGPPLLTGLSGLQGRVKNQAACLFCMAK